MNSHLDSYPITILHAFRALESDSRWLALNIQDSPALYSLFIPCRSLMLYHYTIHIDIEDIIAIAILVCSPRSHSCDPPLRDRDYRKAISVLLQQDASGFYYIGKPISIGCWSLSVLIQCHPEKKSNEYHNKESIQNKVNSIQYFSHEFYIYYSCSMIIYYQII